MRYGLSKLVMKTKHFPTNFVAVFLIFRKDKQIFLIKRANTGYKDGFWSLPAGHVDPDESFKQAGVHEAQEEVGVVFSTDDLQFQHAMHRMNSDKSNRVNVFFKVKDWQGELHNAEPEKASEAGWFEIDNLPEPMVAYVKRALKHIDKGVFYSEEGWPDSEAVT